MLLSTVEQLYFPFCPTTRIKVMPERVCRYCNLYTIMVLYNFSPGVSYDVQIFSEAQRVLPWQSDKEPIYCQPISDTISIRTVDSQYKSQ